MRICLKKKQEQILLEMVEVQNQVTELLEMIRGIRKLRIKQNCISFQKLTWCNFYRLASEVTTLTSTISVIVMAHYHSLVLHEFLPFKNSPKIIYLSQVIV